MKVASHLTLIFVFAIASLTPGLFILSQLLFSHLANYDINVTLFGWEINNQSLVHLAVAISAGLASLITFLLVYFYVKKNIIHQIRQLQIATSYVLRGKVNYKLTLEGNDEVEHLARSFELLKESLRKKAEIEHELHQSKSELERERLVSIGLIAARLAHDIRNPLSVIKNTVEIMKFKLKDKLDDNTNNQLLRLSTSVSRISHQIEDVLDYVRESPLNLKEISFSSLIDSVLATVKRTDEMQIIKPENDIVLTCDPKKIEVVFVNLFMNAIQAMNGKGYIKIRTLEQSGHFIIDIEDSGPGIPPNSIGKIFEPLFTTKQTGTGLGLASCKNIIEQHHGRISVSNNPTRFTIKFPKKIRA